MAALAAGCPYHFPTPTTNGPVNCGNGAADPGEECDDGNTADDDGCDSNCDVELGWECSGSPSTCTPVCGDGVEVGNEGCDDGNHDNTDECPDDVAGGGTCQPAACGDGFVWAGHEECEDGNLDNTDECPDDGANGGTCQAAFCGDGFLRQGEETCDDGNTVGGDGCSSTCVIDCSNGSAADPTFVRCDFPSAGDDYAANDFYAANPTNTRTLWVCSSDDDFNPVICSEDRELFLTDAAMGDCVQGVTFIDTLAVAVYYRVD